MLKMLYETNSFGRLVRTVSSKVTAFLADETKVMLFLAVLGNIIFLEVPEWFFGKGFSVEVFLKIFCLFGWANTLLFIFVLYLKMRFFTSFRKGFFVFHEIFKEFFLFTDFV